MEQKVVVQQLTQRALTATVSSTVKSEAFGNRFGNALDSMSAALPDLNSTDISRWEAALITTFAQLCAGALP